MKFGRASQRSDGLKFGRASQRSDGLESWTCFPEVQGLKFGRASQRSDGLRFGRASQRSDGLEGIIHTNVCGPFTLIPAKEILSISNRDIH